MFSVCATSTGWFGCNKKEHKRHEEIELNQVAEKNNAEIDDNTMTEFVEELGLGMSIYFKQLKFMSILFFLFSLFSIPAFWLFYSGHEATIQNIYDTKGIFSTFTLGNLGSSGQLCSQINNNFESLEF
jgi:hypothetical protein